MKRKAWMAFSIDRQSATPVFEQICSSIRAQAVSGELSEGEKLPPTRVLATELGVSRSTVVTAYDQLVAEGYLRSVRGSGYTLCPMGEVELKTPRPVSNLLTSQEATVPLKPFQAGQPDMRAFPHTQWAKMVARVCRTNPRSMLIGDSVQGNFALRKAIAAHISEWRGIEASPHQIIVTAGSGDALELCLRSLTRPGDVIGLEDPGYLPLRNFVSVSGLGATYLKIDHNGAILPAAPGKTRVVILTPSHQYPLGGAMAPSRRLEFIHWAHERNAWIIEDDYDSEFRYAGRPIPAMAGFDEFGRTVYIGSFSKIFSNSLRLGYVVVPEQLQEKVRENLVRFGVKASYMPQQALAEFISNGDFYRHLRRMRRVYGEKRRFLLDRLAQNLDGYGTFTDHQAGMQVTFHLDSRFSDAEVARCAQSKGITTLPLSGFCCAKPKLNGLVLGFCAFSPEELESALTVLESVLASLGEAGTG